MTMPAGLYYIGDLCYVLHDEWNEVCDLLFADNVIDGGVNEGEFRLKDGRRFALYSTAYGDGQYYDNEGNRYLVDAGSIGCIRIEDIRQTPENFINGGVALTFLQPFETGSDGSTLTFGHISINTNPDYDYGDYDDDYALEEEF